MTTNKRSLDFEKTLLTIVESYEAASELFTNDADLAANLHDHAKLILKKYGVIHD